MARIIEGSTRRDECQFHATSQSDQSTSAAFAQTHPILSYQKRTTVRFGSWRHHFEWSRAWRSGGDPSPGRATSAPLPQELEVSPTLTSAEHRRSSRPISCAFAGRCASLYACSRVEVREDRDETLHGNPPLVACRARMPTRGVRVRRVLTDNGRTYRSRTFRQGPPPAWDCGQIYATTPGTEQRQRRALHLDAAQMDLIDAIQAATRACGNAGLRRMGCGFGCRLDPIQLLVVRQRRALDERLQWRFAGAILARVRPFGVVRLHPHVNVGMRLFQRLVQRTAKRARV